MAGVPVTVAWTAFFVPALFGLVFSDPGLALGMGALVLASVLIHELGHAAAFRAYGVSSSIVLHTMGGATRGERRVESRSGRIVVSLAGPVSELVLLGVPAVWVHRTAELSASGARFAELAVFVTVGWSLFNLLPIVPLDGGHVAEEVVDALWRGRGFVVARVVSVVVAVGVAWVAFSSGWVLVALFLLAMAWQSVEGLRGRRGDGQVDRLRPAVAAYEAGRTGEARDLALAHLQQRLTPEAEAVAVTIAAWSALAEDDPRTAHAVLAEHPLPDRISGHLRALAVEADRSERLNATVDGWLDGEHVHPAAYVRWMDRLALLDDVVDRVATSGAPEAVVASEQLLQVLFFQGQYVRAGRLGATRLRTGLQGHEDHRWLLAYNVACSLDRGGHPADALRWLEVAAEAGIPDPSTVDTDPDLAATRAEPGFAAVRARLAAGATVPEPG